MSNYQRLISYIYAYEGGIKGKNIGFVKLETRNAQCRITVSVKRIYVGGNPIGVYLLSGNDELRIGTLFARNGAGEFRAVVNTQNIEGSGRSIGECYGLTVHDTESAWRCYTTIWEDAVTHAAEVELADVTADRMEQREYAQKIQERKKQEFREQESAGQKAPEKLPISKEIEEEVEREELERLGILRIKARKTEFAELPEEASFGGTELREAEPEGAKSGEAEPETVRAGAAPEFQAMESEEVRTKAEPMAEAAGIEPETEPGERSIKAESGREERGAEAGPERLETEAETGPEEPEAKTETGLEESETGAEGSEAEAETEAEAAGAGLEPEIAGEEMEPIEPIESLSGMEAVPNPVPNTDPRRRLRVVPKERPLTSSIPSPFRKGEESKSEEETWEMLRSRYPKILAFDYEDGCEILTIKPQDIGLLPRENWVYGSNSFLLHGYYYYRYLILARLHQPNGRGRYLLGVPGHYVSNEKYMASMFGFSEFVLSKKQPPKDSRFGYWYTDIKMSQ